MSSLSAQQTLEEIISSNRRVVFADVNVLQGVLDAAAAKDGTEYVVPGYVEDAANVERWTNSDGTQSIVLLPDEAELADCPAFVFYMHGGGFAIDMADSHWDLVLALFDDLRCPIVVPLYPLAPLHKSNEVYACVMESYKRATERFKGMKAVLIGDSAGGHLVVALTQMILEQGAQKPVLNIAMSPWVDLTGDLPGKAEREAGDPMLALAGMNHIAELWRDDDYMNVDLLENNFEGFPPTYIYTGGLELLLPDSEALVKKLEEAGASVKLYVGEGLWHTYPLFPEIVEAGAARADFIHLIRDYTY